MPRIRAIKPGFFTNDDLADLSPLTRLMFIGLWTVSDREGRVRDRPRKLKAEIMPFDDIDCEAALASLVASGFIIRYASGTDRYIQVINWPKHQFPHVNELPSLIPAPEGYNPALRVKREQSAGNMGNGGGNTVNGNTSSGRPPKSPLTGGRPQRRRNGRGPMTDDALTRIEAAHAAKTGGD